MIKDVKIGLIT